MVNFHVNDEPFDFAQESVEGSNHEQRLTFISFDKLPSTSFLRQASFDKLPSTSSERTAIPKTVIPKVDWYLEHLFSKKLHPRYNRNKMQPGMNPENRKEKPSKISPHSVSKRTRASSGWPITLANQGGGRQERTLCNLLNTFSTSTSPICLMG